MLNVTMRSTTLYAFSRNVSYISMRFIIFCWLAIGVSSSDALDFNLDSVGLSVSILDTGNSNYDHETISMRAHLITDYRKMGNWDIHWALEPNINWFKHKLNNPLWIGMEEPNYQEQRKLYTDGIDFMFWGIEATAMARRQLSRTVSLEFSAALGIGHLDDRTERQSKGFTFSETGRAGVLVNLKPNAVFVGYAVTHISNAGFNGLNGGYDLSGFSVRFERNIDFGILP